MSKQDVNRNCRPHRDGERKTARFPGVRADARALGVTAPHLWNVLAGHRHSRRLMAAYRNLPGKAS